MIQINSANTEFLMEYEIEWDKSIMNSKLYTDCSLEMNVDEAMKSEVVHDYSDKKIVVKLEELSVDSVSNENMVNNKEVCKKERIIRRALNTISSCQSKLIDIESSDDEVIISMSGWNPFNEKLNPDYSVCTKSPYHSKVWISLICKEIDSIQDLMTLSRELLKKDYRMSESLLMLAHIKMQDTLSWMDSKDDHYFSFGISPM
ncbi:hypothetical protein Tco_0595418 [Tanacetum coccineum]